MREIERESETLLVVVHVARAAFLLCPAECACLREGIDVESRRTLLHAGHRLPLGGDPQHPPSPRSDPPLPS